MPRWLSRATQVFARREPDRPQSYEVTCDCGGTAQGERQARPSQISCSQCGSTLFVLPANVYPVPRSRRTPAKPATAVARTDVVTEEETGGVATVADAPRSGSPKSHRWSRQEQKPASAPALPQLSVPPTRLLTPFRVVVSCIALVVLATGWWTIRRATMQRAELALRTAAEQGDAALDSGDFAEAAAQFAIASESLETLGRADALAADVRQKLLESRAASRLVLVGLPDILHEAAESRTAKGESAPWERHRGDWIVFDAPVIRSRGGSKLRVDYPLRAAGKGVSIELDSPEIARSLAGSAARTPVRVIFAARFDGCRLSSREPRQWIVALEPESPFLWGNPETYRRLGFHTEDPEAEQETRDVLARQQQPGRAKP